MSITKSNHVNLSPKDVKKVSLRLIREGEKKKKKKDKLVLEILTVKQEHH